MKIAFLFGPYCIGKRPLDFNDLMTNPRGLTGSELGCVVIAKELVKLGHDVALFTLYAGIKLDVWEGVKLYNFDERFSIIKSDWDAIVSWNEPDLLRGHPVEPLRLVSDQLNGFTYCQPGFDDFVDVYLSPSKKHMEYQLSQPELPTTNHDKWLVLPDGCTPSNFTEGVKVPGRIVWASSADRGLHLLLQEWATIKSAVPEAHLKIFYNFDYGGIENYEQESPIVGRDILETAQRIRYIKYALKNLAPLGVEHVGSVSRERIAKEMSEAMVLAYPVSTIRFCEGFSVTIMEACAAGACPVISDVDALGDLYGEVVPMVHSPVVKNMPDFTALVIKALSDEKYRDEVNARCKAFANKFKWDDISKNLEGIILNHPKFKERQNVKT